MHDQNTRVPVDSLDPNEVARAVLALLIDDQPGPQTVEELIRKYAGFEGGQRKARLAVLDSLSLLASHGLVHHLDRFVFPTQAGLLADKLRE
jgi:hypothetical protein